MSTLEGRLAAAMAEAVAHATDHAAAGGLPFVGVLVLTDSTVTAPGTNRVRETGDVTAHAEVEAIRAAGARHGADALAGAVLLATGEPCALCYQYAADHGVTDVRYAVGVDEAAGLGFDYRGPHRGPGGRALAAAATPLRIPGATAPFTTYLDGRARDTRS